MVYSFLFHCVIQSDPRFVVFSLLVSTEGVPTHGLEQIVRATCPQINPNIITPRQFNTVTQTRASKREPEPEQKRCRSVVC